MEEKKQVKADLKKMKADLKKISLTNWLLILISLLLSIIIFQLTVINKNLPGEFDSYYIEKSLEKIESELNDIYRGIDDLEDTTSNIYRYM